MAGERRDPVCTERAGCVARPHRDPRTRHHSTEFRDPHRRMHHNSLSRPLLRDDRTHTQSRRSETNMCVVWRRCEHHRSPSVRPPSLSVSISTERAHDSHAGFTCWHFDVPHRRTSGKGEDPWPSISVRFASSGSCRAPKLSGTSWRITAVDGSRLVPPSPRPDQLALRLGTVGLHAELGGPTEKSRAIENTLRSAALLGVIGATFVACGGLLGGHVGVLLGLGLGAIVVGGGSGGSRIDS